MSTDLRSAKQPIHPVAGPYGHPFHPVLVTVPIGAWVASLVFDLASKASDEPRIFNYGAYWLIAIGLVGALAAAVFGLLDLLTIPRGTKAFSTGLTHLALNLVVVVLFAVNFLLRRDDPGSNLDGVPTGKIVLSAIALVILGVSGWLGGQLAYRYGVRVADEETQSEGFR
jgi:uncharacterized membrane protein